MTEDLKQRPHPQQSRAVQFPTDEISALVDSVVRYDLAESTCPPLAVGEITDLATLNDFRLGYGTSPGSGELRALIGADVGVAADAVLVTAGAIEALFLVAQDRCHGRAVVLAPYFPPAVSVPTGLGAHVDTVSLSFDEGYRLRLDAIADALNPETTLVSLASPQNPSGVRFSDQELTDLVSVVEARAPEAVILVDETYRASTYGSASVPASAAALSPRIVTSGSLSKAHGAPGIRVGWLTSTDAVLIERLRNAKFLTSVSCSTLDEALGAEVLRSSDRILAPRAARLSHALAELEAWAVDQPVDLVRPGGGAMCCLRMSPDRVPDEAVRGVHDELGRREVRVAPGSWFGEDDRVFRVGFGHLDPTDFTEALSRLGEVLGSVSRG